MQLTNPDIKTLKMIKHYIEVHIHEQVSIARLCTIAGMAENKLTRSFKFGYQISLSKYHLFISMEYAKALLEDKMQISVKEIAFRLGYTSTSHFSRAFSRVFFNSPVDFRNH